MTNEEMDQDVADAATYLSCCPSIRVDRCRHPTVDETALWFFDNGELIMSAHRLTSTTSNYRWECSRMNQGQPVARKCTKTILETAAWALEYASNNVARNRRGYVA